MEEIFFLFLFFLFPFIWFLLLKLSSVKIFTISIPSIVIISIFIFQYIGFPVLFFFLDDYRAEFVSDRSIIWEIFFWTIFTITFLILGLIVGRNSFGLLHKPGQYNPYSNIIIPVGNFQILLIFILFIISIFTLGFYLSKIGLDRIALFSSIGMEYSEFSNKELRSLMTNSFQGKYHWYRFFMRDFMMIISLTFFSVD